MAVYRLFPEKDTFISSEVPTGNAGKDEIVELGGYPDISSTGRTNRILTQYNTSEIQDVLTNKVGNNAYKGSIKMYLADAYELPTTYTVYAYPLSDSWDNGVGKFGDIPTNTSGVSWVNRSVGASNPWTTSAYPTGVTGSYISGQAGGGTWYTGSMGVSLAFSQSHQFNSNNDVDIDVTPAIGMMVSMSLDNNGFILKLSNALEFNTTSSIRLKYYGVDTNTIFPPFLEIKWDDSSYVTGSLGVLNNSVSNVSISNNRGNYTAEGKQRFRISAKPKYPSRTFTTGSVYLTNYALPSTTYWGLRDENTEEMIVDFDTNYTKVSCDSVGSYFDVYMDGLQPERYYRILIKTVLDGSTTVIDNKNIFKVVRNG